MYWDVKRVRPLPDYRIYVEISDGRKGVFDMKPYLDLGVFRELRNPHYFNQVGILFGAVTWPNEQDIAPETLLAGLQSCQDAPETEKTQKRENMKSPQPFQNQRDYPARRHS